MNFIKDNLSSLRRTNSIKSIISIGTDWSLIVASFYLIQYSLMLSPIALLIIGSRQRALSNLTHDASHVNLFKNRKINDFISNLLCALPMFETVEHYRKSHTKHHQHLGDINLDPDSKSHLNYGYNDSLPWKGDPLKNYLKITLNKDALKSSFLGSLLNLNLKGTLFVILWWIGIGSLIGTLSSATTLLSILGIWLLTKLTTYHAIRIFAEFLDHSGLKQKDVISFTRNLPHDGLFRFITHPNSDTFHIVHHLYPKIPHYNLARADKVLSQRSDYKSGHHCDSYFLGVHSAVKCWVGECSKGTA